MSFEADLYALLSGRSALADVVSDRIYPTVAKQGVSAPYVVYNVIPGDPLAILSGDTGRRQIYEIQLDAYAATELSADQLAVILEAAMKDGSETIKPTYRTRWDPPFDFEARLYRVTLEYSVFHRSNA